MVLQDAQHIRMAQHGPVQHLAVGRTVLVTQVVVGSDLVLLNGVAAGVPIGGGGYGHGVGGVCRRVHTFGDKV